MARIILTHNSEYGQASVFMAVGHALQQLDPETEIHVVSFHNIAREVASASEQSVRAAQEAHGKAARPWEFHALSVPSLLDAVWESDKDRSVSNVMEMPPGFFNMFPVSHFAASVLLPWDGPEFVKGYREFAALAEEIRPDLVAVDSLFAIGLTACRGLGLKHVVLSPNTIKEFAAGLQPRAAGLWKYPVPGSGFSYPVPRRKIPLNIAYSMIQVGIIVGRRSARKARKYVRQELKTDIITMQTLIMRPPRGEQILVATRKELEFPFAYVPEHLKPCGPIIRPVAPVGEVDPELAAWLARGPTVFICLGTHRFFYEDEAVEMATAIRQLLDAAQDKAAIGGVPGRLQVLWKLKQPGKLAASGKNGSYPTGQGSRVHGVLAEAIDGDRVRVVDWIKPNPAAVLQAGTVVCTVNHGGANSFYDGVMSGVPQIILPAWFDCYDFAHRVEVLGIGVWASRTSMPKCVAKELGPALVEVVLGPRAEDMRKKVRELQELVNQTPGAEVAARAILDEAGKTKKKDEGEKKDNVEKKDEVESK
ncbi:hypothetical protein VTJ83DRAFT_6887 [Remersonia thermophila]|uniref:Erythromycin biosynthesis protein CIII-like C-terminal domain-containing protein n=1 Tax=Remersonia thermophila TaxID=72144 RepID=A0ABR4D877_9PEZI